MPEALVTYSAKAETNAEANMFCTNIDTSLKILEQVTPWANLTELCIGMLLECLNI